ncbi:MAG TPA: L-fucose/L-arabinose isomerase family protein [Candidatus Limnocylindria bacterium]|nr:L-fucose/L-arabinose isomerase family protein [Candidatus Limnocylindria bacterium]
MLQRKAKPARIGLYSAGLKAYWPQFAGLRERLEGYNRFIAEKLSQWGEVRNFGLVDDEDRARACGEQFNALGVDIIFAHSATYFTSATVLPLHQICKAPTVVLNLQPGPAMNYAKTGTGDWLAYCVGCPVPELSNAFQRAGIPLTIVNGLLGLAETPEGALADEDTAGRPEAVRAWNEIGEWAMAAGAARSLRSSRFGFLGGYYSGMLDMYSDLTMLSARFGIHVEILEMCDLARHLGEVTEADVAQKEREVAAFFEISGDSPSDPIARRPTPEQMRWSCTVAAAQERMVEAYRLDALSYYYHGAQDNEYERLQSGFIVGHSLLTASGVPCAGEGDIKTGVAMKICDLLGKGGSYSEIVAMDYDMNTMLIGHDGPFHVRISDGKPLLRGMGVYHGKRGSGVSVEANVVSGPVTTLGLTQLRDGSPRLIVSQGEARKHPILTIGNTQTHVDFGMGLDAYMDEWFSYAPTHHCALSVGHNARLFGKVAKLLGVESVRVGV